MTQRDESNSRVTVTIKINGAAGERLLELANAQNVPPSKLAREVLEEILPKIESVQRRVAIKLREGTR